MRGHGHSAADSRVYTQGLTVTQLSAVFRTLLVTIVGLVLQGAVSAQVRPPAPAPAAGTLYLSSERIPLATGGLVEAERGVIFVPASATDLPVLPFTRSCVSFTPRIESASNGVFQPSLSRV